jgi:hypothetical protein
MKPMCVIPCVSLTLLVYAKLMHRVTMWMRRQRILSLNSLTAMVADMRPTF